MTTLTATVPPVSAPPVSGSVVTAPVPRRVTPEELLRMPEGKTCELVDGFIVEKNVSLSSSEAEGIVLHRLRTFAKVNDVAGVYPATLGYRCFPDNPDRIRKPDVTVVRTERLATLEDPDPGFMPIVPDLAVEVLPPNDLVREVDEKVKEYLDAGFPLVWVANPRPRTIVAYEASGRPVLYIAEDEITAEAALPGFRCRVAELFSPATTPTRPGEPSRVSERV